jgi:succinate dehydrogenase / fumarate reductase membrane anchor subunit
MAEPKVATTKVAGTWPWFLQRVSAVLLIVLLAVHIVIDHFWNMSDLTSELSVANIHLRLGQLVWIGVDWSMLAVVLFHGLNGTRTVMFDFDCFMKRKKMVDVGLWVLGIAMLVWGIIILMPFING